MAMGIKDALERAKKWARQLEGVEVELDDVLIKVIISLEEGDEFPVNLITELAEELGEENPGLVCELEGVGVLFGSFRTYFPSMV